MPIFGYCEVPFNTSKELIPQLNEFCKDHPGYHYHCMAQKISARTMDFKTGQPKIDLVLIFEVCFEPSLVDKPNAQEN